MSDITNTLEANREWQEFQDRVAKLSDKLTEQSDKFHLSIIVGIAEELIRAGYNNEVMPCISRLDHQYDGGTYSSCWKCGEPEH